MNSSIKEENWSKTKGFPQIVGTAKRVKIRLQAKPFGMFLVRIGLGEAAQWPQSQSPECCQK
jgi:hypothetical protein